MSILWTSPAWSWPLLLVVAAGAMFLTVRFYGQSRPHPTVGLRRTLVILRSAALLLLVLALAGPILSRLNRQDVPGQLVFLVEDSASMALQGSPQYPDRWAQALATVARVDSALGNLDLNVETRILRGNGLADLQEFGLDDPVIVEPLHHGTNLTALLRKAANRLAADPVRGLILVSDGQETVRLAANTQQGAGSAALLSSATFMAVGIGDPVGNSDRLIKDIRYPETAFQGDQVLVEATVMHRSLGPAAPTPVTVRLLQGDRILAEKTLQAGPGATNFELSYVPSESGLQMLELEVSPLDNERFLTNNRVSLGVDIHKARTRLLLLAEKPGWNVRFLAQAAQRETRLSLEVVYASEKGLVFADSLKPFVAPKSLQQWLEYEGVILAGWSGANGRLDHSLLGQAVESGLGLMVLPDAMVSRARRLAEPGPQLKALLPVTLEQAAWKRGPLFARLDSLAYDHPIFSGLAAASGINLLAQAPPLPAMVPCRTRDGFQSLLIAVGNEPGQVGQVDEVPLLVVGRRDAGRVAFWGGSRLWEMTFWNNVSAGKGKTEDHAARQILRNLLVWLADGTRESGLSFVGRQAFYQEGQSIQLAGQWRDMRGHAIADGRVSLEIQRLGEGGTPGDSRSFPVSGFDSLRGQYDFNLPAMPPGRYSIQLLGHADSVVESPVEELVITSHSVEQTQVRQDARKLQQLSERLGGSYHNLHDDSGINGLVKALAGLDWNSTEIASRRKWDPSAGWPFLVVVVLLLACEWFLRRRHGLL